MTAARHHPGDDLLLEHAAGTLPTGPALVLQAHLEGCARCRAQFDLCLALGGALLDELPPATLPADAWARTLAAVDALPAAAPPARPPAAPPPLPAGAAWPRALAGCAATRWRWIGPGMR